MTQSRSNERPQELTPAKIAANEIADQLGEREFGPRRLVQSIVEVCGAEFANQMLREAMEVEEQGGLLLLDGTRRRTFGGVFFYLARGRMSPEARKAVFPTRARRKSGSTTTTNKKAPAKPGLLWQDRLEIVQPLLAEQGELSTVKVTLIGRPGRVDVRSDLVVTTMSHSAKNATLPKGLPQPPDAPTTYTVYIALKQWKKIEESIRDPKDALIIEGLAAFDPEIQGIAVFAQSTTTKLTETAKREAQKAKTAAENGEAPAEAAPKPAPKPASDRPTQPQAGPLFNIPSGASSADAQKLRELHAAADLYQQKLADMEQRNQRFGLEMTQKLLKSVEDQIKAIEQKYG